MLHSIDKTAVMLDLETLGTTPGHVVTSIGAVVWQPRNGYIHDRFKRNICIKSSLRHGMKVDGDTLVWWLKQSDQARQAMLDAPVDLVSALCEFSAWFIMANQYGEIGGLWAHGANFDPPMLEAACCAIDVKVPWHYRLPRDTRTLFALAGYEPPRAGVTHDALQDAVDQAGWVTEALRMLQSNTTPAVAA